jgi:hypothetical protein
MTMLKILLYLLGAFVVFVIYRYIVTVRGKIRVEGTIMAEVDAVIKILKEGGPPPLDEILVLADSSRTRSHLYRAMQKIQKEDLFPKDQCTPAQIAESDLVAWLLHPNELDAVPDEIQMVYEDERADDDNASAPKYRFFVFKFRTHPPHWAASKGWLAGIAGPYWDGENSPYPPAGVFSQFEPFDSRTPQEHLEELELTVIKKLG